MVTKDTEIVNEIARLKKQRNAVILVHNYQRLEVQDIADFTGDSLELSQQAAKTTAGVIVFCGVHFMAETAYIINPDQNGPAAGQRIRLPHGRYDYRDPPSSTSKSSIPARKWSAMSIPPPRSKPNRISAALPATPSKSCRASATRNYLCARPVPWTVGRRKNRRKMHLWPGFCPTHMKILPEDILALKQQHPGYIAMVHPECRPDAKAAADEVLSTGGMVRFVQESSAPGFIIGTETGILHRLQQENPGKVFYSRQRQSGLPQHEAHHPRKSALVPPGYEP